MYKYEWMLVLSPVLTKTCFQMSTDGEDVETTAENMLQIGWSQPVTVLEEKKPQTSLEHFTDGKHSCELQADVQSDKRAPLSKAICTVGWR